jgi:hypothetical protein
MLHELRNQQFTLALLLAIFCLLKSFIVEAAGDSHRDQPEVLFASELRQYPAIEKAAGPKAPELKIQSAEARRYQTRLRESWGLAKKPNFAGRYYVPIDIGCGVGCKVIFVIDWQTGETFKAPRDSVFYVSEKSRLLITAPFPKGYAEVPGYYEFRNRKFLKRDLSKEIDGNP